MMYMKIVGMVGVGIWDSRACCSYWVVGRQLGSEGACG